MESVYNHIKLEELYVSHEHNICENIIIDLNSDSDINI